MSTARGQKTTPKRPRSPQPNYPTKLTSPDGKFSCWVKTDQRLQVYEAGVKVDKAEAYIASEEGSAYIIYTDLPKSTRSKRHPLFVCHATIDGVYCGIRSTAAGYSRTEFDGAFVGGAIRPFVFSKPTLTEDATIPTEKQAKQLSTIKISICRGRYIYSTADQSSSKELEIDEIGPISEKAKKAKIASVTQFGPAGPQVGHGRSVQTNPGDWKNPVYTFTFNYMPLPVLQAFGVAPRQPAENGDEEEQEQQSSRGHQGTIIVKDESEVEEDSESEEEDADTEEEELLKRLALIQAQKSERAAKRMREEEEGMKPADIMRKRLRRAARKDGGVVDLTGEDDEVA